MENDNVKNLIMIVGAGAVENAWNPIISAIKNLHGLETNDDGANFMLAREVYLNKFYAAIKHPKATEFLEIQKSNLSILKEEIANQIILSQEKQEIRIRKYFYKLLETHIYKKRALIVTTNWDTVVDFAIKEFCFRNGFPKAINVLHLHGNIDNPNDLYLPSEITPELYRPKEQEQKLGNDHAFFTDRLKEAHEIIFYGISLDPLDAELTLSLSVLSQSSNLQRVLVVNPEHNKICNRLRLILFNKNIPIDFINPLD